MLEEHSKSLGPGPTLLAPGRVDPRASWGWPGQSGLALAQPV